VSESVKRREERIDEGDERLAKRDEERKRG